MPPTYRTSLCTHCRRERAEDECPACGEGVCGECARDIARCKLGAVRELRMGMGHRLIHVDSQAHVGLVRRFGAALSLVDLRDGCWIDWQRAKPRRGHLFEPRLLPGNRIAFDLVLAGNRSDDVRKSLGILIQDHDGDSVRLIGDEVPCDHGLTLSADGSFGVRSLRDETVQLIQLEPPYSVQRFEPMRQRVIQSVSFDPRTGYLLTSTWGMITLSIVTDDGIERVGRRSLGDGDIEWTALHQQTLFACVSGNKLVVLDLDGSPRLGTVRYEISGLGGDPAQSLSPDGRWVAASSGRTLRVFDITTGAVTTIEGHTDTVSFTCFSRDSKHVIAGDNDARIRFWPLDGGDLVKRPVVSRKVAKPGADPEPPEVEKPERPEPPPLPPPPKPSSVPRAARLISLPKEPDE